jgi:predicted ATP-binding protein involved in virulence
MVTPDTSLRIKSIKVKGLFGLYNHLVTLKDDRVTVMHGPNGVGKTVFLKLTNSFLAGKYHEIIRVPFDTFEIMFRDDSVARIELSGGPLTNKKLTLSFQNAGRVVEKVSTVNNLDGICPVSDHAT